MNTRTSLLGGIPLIAIEGDLETASVWRLAPLMLDCLAPAGDRLIIDLTDCPYQDSNGIGLFLRLLFDVIDGCWLGVIGANRALLRVFHLTGLASHRNFCTCDSPDHLQRVLHPNDLTLTERPETEAKGARADAARVAAADRRRIAWPKPLWSVR